MMATKTAKTAKGLEHEKRKGESVGISNMYPAELRSALDLDPDTGLRRL